MKVDKRPQQRRRWGQPALSPAPVLPPAGLMWKCGGTSVEKQTHKKIIVLGKHSAPRSSMLALLEINLGGKYFSNDVHFCTPFH